MDHPFIPLHGRITSYGYPGDTTPDTNSTNAIGAWDNHLEDGISLAVSRDIEQLFRLHGVLPKHNVELSIAGGETLILRWDDRTAEEFHGKLLVGRLDIYGKHKPSKFVDDLVIGFRQAP